MAEAGLQGEVRIDGTARRDGLPLVALGVLVVAMLFGLLLPIYTDEIAWRFHERAWLDNGFDVWMNDVCGPNTVALAPAFMMPVRWFSATMNLALADPLWVRLTGIVLGLALVAGFWRLVGRLEPDAERRGLLRAIVCGVLACGFLPLLLILSRPEQPVFLAALGMALLTVPAMGQDITARRAWLVSVTLVILVGIGISYHLKGLLYSVLALACLAVLGSGRQHALPRIVAALAIIVLDAIAARYWVGRFSCPENAVMATELNNQNVAGLIVQQGLSIDLVARQIGDSTILSYIPLGAIHPYPMSGWMPEEIFSPAEGFFGHAMIYTVWLMPTVLALWCIAAFLRHAGWRGLFEPRVVLSATMVAVTWVWGLSQARKLVYETSHVLPAFLLAVLFALTLRPAPRRLDVTALRNVAAIILALSAFSQVIVIGRMAGPLAATLEESGRLPLQEHSFGTMHYPQVRADIRRAMQQAGMGQDGATDGTGPDGRLNRLLVDDVTYLAVQRAYLPIYTLGVMGPWNGPILDPAAYLASRDSDGIVATCASLWQEAADIAARSGEVCAVNRQQLRQLAGGRPFVPASYTENIPLADGAYPDE